MDENDPRRARLVYGMHGQLTWAFPKAAPVVADERYGGSSNLPRTKHGYTLRLPKTPAPDSRVANDPFAPQAARMHGG